MSEMKINYRDCELRQLGCFSDLQKLRMLMTNSDNGTKRCKINKEFMLILRR